MNIAASKSNQTRMIRRRKAQERENTRFFFTDLPRGIRYPETGLFNFRDSQLGSKNLHNN